MSIRKTQQQNISSLRRKDTMWIYKNPQGLQILEDVSAWLRRTGIVELIDLLYRNWTKDERNGPLDTERALHF